MDARILGLCREDPRFAYEAYEFVCAAVEYTQNRLGRDTERDATDERHVSGAELLRGTCELAVKEFGMMAPVVFRQWGVRTTDHVGELVFKMIGANLLSKSDRDDPDDFRALFDLHEQLSAGFELTLDDASKRGAR
ncbi:MAG: Minf_1886 family protein [Gemmata sp.]